MIYAFFRKKELQQHYIWDNYFYHEVNKSQKLEGMGTLEFHINGWETTTT